MKVSEVALWKLEQTYSQRPTNTAVVVELFKAGFDYETIPSFANLKKNLSIQHLKMTMAQCFAAQNQL